MRDQLSLIPHTPQFLCRSEPARDSALTFTNDVD
ncbi:hypothetical protein EMIT0215P_70221 [Pseudomonas serboccidentalis]